MKRIYLTHSGLFHADEVAGYAVLKAANLVSGFIRTSIQEAERLVSENPEAYIVADILRKYKPKKYRFDHHHQNQATTPELYRKNGIPYATAGLLWKWCGDTHLLDLIRERRGDWYADTIFNRVDKLLFEQLDANDAAPDWYVEGYAAGNSVRVTTISHLISAFNSDDLNDDEMQRHAFISAYEFFSRILSQSIVDAELYAENLDKFEDTTKYDSETNTIICLEQVKGWQEMAAEIYPDALYLFGKSMFPDTENPYSLLAVPATPGRRELKKPIERPEGWMKFIHAGKFIAAVASWEEAKELILRQ